MTMPTGMTHEKAVAIARSGEGAVVGELRSLSAQLENVTDVAEQRRLRIEKFMDAIADMKKQIEAMEFI